MSAGRARPKAVSGFVVKKEYFETNPTTGVRVKHREEVSRIYHSRDAAVALANLLQQRASADVYYYVHEKGKTDNVTLF